MSYDGLQPPTADEIELRRLRDADELRKRAHDDIDCVLCGSRGMRSS